MGTPFMGEIRIMSFNFAPKTWALCNGQTLPINQNQALFSLLGTRYGGNGQTEFALPDLRDRVPVCFGSATGMGASGGEAAHTITQSEMPFHNHTLSANVSNPAASNIAGPPTGAVLGQAIGEQQPGGPFTVQPYSTATPGDPGAPAVTLASVSISNVGGSQAHNNMQPYLALTFCIALQGIFPSQT